MRLTLRRHAGSIAVFAAALLVLVLVAAGAAQAASRLTVRGSVEQVQVTGAAKGARLALLDRRGRPVQGRRAGALGGAVFRAVPAGKGYRVRRGGARGARSGAVTVL